MVTLDSFFQALAIIGQFGRCLPSGAVNARQLLPIFIATPVGAGRWTQRDADRLGIDIFGASDMRPAAKVGEHILRIDGQTFAGLGDGVAVVIDAAIDQVFNQFELVGLVMKQLAGFVSGYFAPGEFVALREELLHPLFDPFDVLVADGSW